MVHNGIIENHRALRAELEADGAVFASDTDTETIVQLCDRALRTGVGPVEAARATLARLEGAFALCFLFEGEDDLLVAARRGSPLAVGYGDGESFVGSDALALAPLTHRIAYLDEGDHAVVTRERVEIFDAAGAAVRREAHHIPAENYLSEKGPYKHFMAKEMHEQPAAIGDALARYLGPDGEAVPPPAGSTSPPATGWCWWPAAPRTMPAMWRSTGSSGWRGCRSRSRSRRSSATASRRSGPGRSASSSASRGRPPTRWRRCATCAGRAGGWSR